MSCPAYARVGALYIAVNKKLKQLLGSKKLRINFQLFYKERLLERETLVREVYAFLHEYGEFPVKIDIVIQPIYVGIPPKALVFVDSSTQADLESEEADLGSNIFGNLESFFDGVQSSTLEPGTANAADSEVDAPLTDSLDEMNLRSSEEKRRLFDEKELVILANSVDLKKFFKYGCVKPKKLNKKKSRKLKKGKSELKAAKV